MSVWRTLSRKFRNNKQAKSKSNDPRPKRSPAFEALEPRLLLSAETPLATLNQSGITLGLMGDDNHDFRFLADESLASIDGGIPLEFSVSVGGDLSYIGGTLEAVTFLLRIHTISRSRTEWRFVNRYRPLTIRIRGSETRI